MTVGTLIGITIESLGMLVLGWQVGKFGLRNNIYPSKFEGARQGRGCFIMLLIIGVILYGINAIEIQSLSFIITIVVPFGLLLASFLFSRMLHLGPWSVFGVDMNAASLISEIHWQFIKEAHSEPALELVDTLGSILTSHEDWRIRRVAALAFQQSKASTAFRYLQQGLKDSDWRVQNNCLKGIHAIGTYLVSTNKLQVDVASHILDDIKDLLARANLHERVKNNASKLASALKTFLTEHQ